MCESLALHSLEKDPVVNHNTLAGFGDEPAVFLKFYVFRQFVLYVMVVSHFTLLVSVVSSYLRYLSIFTFHTRWLFLIVCSLMNTFTDCILRPLGRSLLRMNKGTSTMLLSTLFFNFDYLAQLQSCVPYVRCAERASTATYWSIPFFCFLYMFTHGKESR